jgi:hypothetical protein
MAKEALKNGWIWSGKNQAILSGGITSEVTGESVVVGVEKIAETSGNVSNHGNRLGGILESGNGKGWLGARAWVGKKAGGWEEVGKRRGVRVEGGIGGGG